MKKIILIIIKLLFLNQKLFKNIKIIIVLNNFYIIVSPNEIR